VCEAGWEADYDCEWRAREGGCSEVCIRTQDESCECEDGRIVWNAFLSEPQDAAEDTYTSFAAAVAQEDVYDSRTFDGADEFAHDGLAPGVWMVEVGEGREVVCAD
jgi:hypothetical protein